MESRSLKGVFPTLSVNTCSVSFVFQFSNCVVKEVHRIREIEISVSMLNGKGKTVKMFSVDKDDP